MRIIYLVLWKSTIRSMQPRRNNLKQTVWKRSISKYLDFFKCYVDEDLQ